MTLGIIGFGAFSELIVKHLKPFCTIYIYSRRDVSKKARAMGVKIGTLEQVAACDIIIIGVVVQHFEEITKKIKKFIKPSALVIDVCSVKIKPAKLMQKHLPKAVDILATHPLFGPQSGKNGVKGLKIVVCPIRIKDKNLKKIKSFLKNKLELTILERTPKEHDKQMAYVQGLTHFIGKAISELAIPQSDQATIAYDQLIRIKDLLEEDSNDLFLTIENENPYAASIRNKFVKKLNEIEEKITKK